MTVDIRATKDLQLVQVDEVTCRSHSFFRCIMLYEWRKIGGDGDYTVLLVNYWLPNLAILLLLQTLTGFPTVKGCKEMDEINEKVMRRL